MKWMTETQYECMVLMRNVVFFREHPTLAIKKFLGMSKSYKIEGVDATMYVEKERLYMVLKTPLTDDEGNEIDAHMKDGEYHIKDLEYIDNIVRLVCDVEWKYHNIKLDDIGITFVM